MSLALSLLLTLGVLGALGVAARRLDARWRRIAWTLLALVSGPLLALAILLIAIVEVATQHLDAAGRATVLARGISLAINCGALGLAVSAAAVAAGWAVVALRSRSTSA